MLKYIIQKVRTLFRVLLNPGNNLHLLFSNTDKGIKAFSNLSSFLNHKSLKKRKDIIKPHLDSNKFQEFKKNGFYHIKYRDLDKIDRLIISLKKIKLDKSNAKKKFLISNQICSSDKVFKLIRKLILNDNFFVPLVNYFEHVPVLNMMALWHSPNKEYEKGRSQDFHLDCEDTKQIKVFIALDKITLKSGPMNIIMANESERIINYFNRNSLGYVNSKKISDSEIFKHINKSKVKTLVADRGDILMVDTSRCYHYGSRPGTVPRNLLFLQFLSLSSNKIPIKFGQEPYKCVESMLFSYS